jgi:hypothetical protein
MTILVSAVIAVLAAQTAVAEQRENKPFVTVNGRSSAAAPAGPRIFTVKTPGGGASANTPAAGQAPVVTNAMIGGAPSDGGRAFIGGGRQAAARTSTGRAVHRGGKTFRAKGGRAVDGGDAGGATTTSTEEAPPNYSKPGALIRTTGQQPKYEKAGDPRNTEDVRLAEQAGKININSGEIVFNDKKGAHVGRAPGIQQGPKDTPPPPNPVAGGNYTGGAVANTGATSTGSGGSGNSGGKDNNGSGNNDKNKPGDTYDPQGGDKAMEESFNAAF